MTTVRLISLGCSKNLVDSEVMLGLLAREHFSVLPGDLPADIGIVNTCGFIDAAKGESINTILELAQEKKEGRLKLLIVTGCLSQRYATELPCLIPEVDAFIGTGDFGRLAKIIHEKLEGSAQINFVRQPTQELPRMDLPRVQSTPFYYRYVKVSEGCSHTCSFCTIPLMRGGLKSRTVSDILDEIKKGEELGVKEFNLIAQDLNEYGRDLVGRERDSVPSLYHLLEEMALLPGNFWVRLLYMYPLQFPDRLIDLVKDHPHVVPYVDIPLQHINDRILKSMKRGSSSRYIYRLLEKLKKAIPNIVLRTTFITGYPGETDEEFEELVRFIREIEFDRVGVFTYSQEEGTPAALLPDQVSLGISQKRRDILMEVQQNISYAKNQRLVGQTFEVLYERLGVGRFYGQAPEVDGVTFIKDSSEMSTVGEFTKVKITEGREYDLVGELV